MFTFFPVHLHVFFKIHTFVAVVIVVVVVVVVDDDDDLL